MKSEWIEYKGKKIFAARYNDFSNDETLLCREISSLTGVISREPGESVLLLVYTQGSVASPNIVQAIKESGLKIKNNLKKTAVLGIKGVRKVLFKSVAGLLGLNVKTFEDEAAAKEWLIGD